MSLVSVRNPGQDLPKIVAELQGLTFSLVAGAAADTAIAVTGIEAEDTVIKALNLTDLTEISLATLTVGNRQATGTLTVGDGIADGDTVTVNGKVYTFRDVVESPSYNAAPAIIPFDYDVSGSDEAVVAARLAKVLMSNDSALSAVAVGAVVTVTWRVAGTVGNAKTLVTSGAHVVVSGATLSGGTATNGVKFSGDTSSKKILLVWFNKQ